MSTAEAVQKSPVEEVQGGLTYEQNTEAKKLAERESFARYHKREADRDFNSRGERYSGAFGFDHAAKALAWNGLRRARKAGSKHYEANRDAYHAQAIQDARAEGVDIRFSGDVAENVQKRSE